MQHFSSKLRPALAFALLFAASVGVFLPAAAQAAGDPALREQIRKAYKQNGQEITEAELDVAEAAFMKQRAALFGSAMAVKGEVESGVLSGRAQPAIRFNSVPEAAPAPAFSEAELLKQITAWGAPSPVRSVRMLRDGIEIDGRPLIDPDGFITQYSVDEATGDLGYVVDLPDEQKVVKLMRAGSGTAIRIGTLVRNGAAWTARFATGASANGYYFAVQPNGLAMSRDAGIFLYQAGKGLQAHAVPRGYVVAPLQKGNIARTGYVLLERVNATGQDNPISGMFSSVRAIGKAVGATRKEDYALMRLADARLVPLNVEADGKLQAVGQDCRRRNSVVNDCRSFVTFESLFNNIGQRSHHYFWRIDWTQTASGPVAVVNEGSVLNVVMLDDGRASSVYKRTLGINEFDLVRGPEGVPGVRVVGGLSTEVIPDVVAAANAAAQSPNGTAAGKP